MDLIFFRHGIAGARAIGTSDFERELTGRGRERVRIAAKGVKKLLEKDAKIAIWSSSKLRAIQTAEILSLELEVDEILEFEFIANGDFQSFGEKLAEVSENLTLIVVGHSPYLETWAKRILNFELPMKKAGVIGILIENTYELSGELIWMMQPKGWKRLAEASI